MEGEAVFEFFDTICRQVSNRVPDIQEFAKKHDMIIFVAGEKSSNGKLLFAECKKHNPNSYIIHTPDQLDPSILSADKSIGICGATSTPMWQMEEISDLISKMIPKLEIEKAAF